jgi:endogenous inhibitor of DNA gyrase (YacG/DUF329 family)
MSGENKPQLRCPICKKPVETGAEDFPFCSERCRTFDLGKWASGDYVIRSPLRDTEEHIGSGTSEIEDEDL